MRVTRRAAAGLRGLDVQAGSSIELPHWRHSALPVSDMRAMVEWAPNPGQSERSSKRVRHERQR